jgi:hypothetical protein
MHALALFIEECGCSRRLDEAEGLEFSEHATHKDGCLLRGDIGRR